jgi:ribosomal protein L18E
VADAVVVINGTVFSAETKSALAGIVIAAIHTSSSVFARIEIFGTELDLLFAVNSCQGVIKKFNYV